MSCMCQLLMLTVVSHKIRARCWCLRPYAAQSQLLLSLLLSASQACCIACRSRACRLLPAFVWQICLDSCCCSPCFLMVCTDGLSALLQPLQVSLEAAARSIYFMGVRCWWLHTRHDLRPYQVRIRKRAAACCWALEGPKQARGPHTATQHRCKPRQVVTSTFVCAHQGSA